MEDQILKINEFNFSLPVSGVQCNASKNHPYSQPTCGNPAILTKSGGQTIKHFCSFHFGEDISSTKLEHAIIAYLLVDALKREHDGAD